MSVPSSVTNTFYPEHYSLYNDFIREDATKSRGFNSNLPLVSKMGQWLITLKTMCGDGKNPKFCKFDLNFWRTRRSKNLPLDVPGCCFKAPWFECGPR